MSEVTYCQPRRARPNTRVQRTRSSPSAPHSPLTRRPLGGSLLQGGLRLTLLLGAALGSLGCESAWGKLYWAGTAPGYRVKTECGALITGGGTSVRVYVGDWMGRYLPGAHIRAVQQGSTLTRDSATDTSGHAVIDIPPGIWNVDAELSGFRSGSATVEITADQACTITFLLRLDDTSPMILVTEHRGAA